MRLHLKRDARTVFCLRSLRLFPLTGEGQPYLSRFDLNFDENRKIAYFIASDVSGGVLPSEKDLLPAHLRGKSLAELAKHTLLLFNQMWLPEARE